MRKKIVWRLTGMFLLMLLVFTLVLGGVFFLLFRHHTVAVHRAELEEQAVLIADNFSQLETGNRKMGHGGGMGHGSYIRFLDGITMSNVWIVDRELNSFSYGHNQIGSTEDLPEQAERIVSQVFQGEITYGDDFSGLLEAPSLTVGAPIVQADGQVVGAVLLHSPISGINDAVSYGIYALGLGAAVAMMFTAGTAMLLSWHVTGPLRQMKDAAAQLAEGKYDVKTQVKQEDEIGELAQTLDVLAERLNQASREQAALDQMREDFVANVSHELRTPVAVLRGSLEVLHDRTVTDPEEVEQYYSQMLLESRHMERLVNDLLDLSRLQDAAFNLDMEEVDLGDIVRDSMRTIRRTAAAKSLTIECFSEEGDWQIRGDYVRIRQMLYILLDNAMKFSDENRVITAGLSRGVDGPILWVENYGDPIPEEDREHIFDRFHKVCSPKNKTGTGLGLPIAWQIAKRHGAKILVDCDGGITRFSICFRDEPL